MVIAKRFAKAKEYIPVNGGRKATAFRSGQPETIRCYTNFVMLTESGY